MGAILSIMGLYNYDNSVFDLMQFPDGFTDQQKKTVTDNILVECAELEFLYPNATVAKNIIGLWSAKEKPYWNRVYAAAQLEYNPIENYRRNEEESILDGSTDQHSGTDNRSITGADKRSLTGQDIQTASGSDTTTGNSGSKDTESGTDTTTNKTTGYDSNDFVNHDSSAVSYGHQISNITNASNTTQYGKVDTMDHNTADNLDYNSLESLKHGEKIEHSGNSKRQVLAYGNIGVTTSQDMLTQEMEVAKIIQVIPVIIESFKNRFCLLVY